MKYFLYSPIRLFLCVFLALFLPLGGIPLPSLSAALSPEPVALPALNTPLRLCGIKIAPEHPLRLDFLLEDNTHMPSLTLKNETTRLVKYFLTALTVPEKELWVNLSPNEQDRIIPPSLGETIMGRDMLEQDQALKQEVSLALAPGHPVGDLFWKRFYTLASEQGETADMPVNLVHKAWITLDQVRLHENSRNGVFVSAVRLKVLLKTDPDIPRVSLGDQERQTRRDALAEGLLREILLPYLEEQVNNDARFAPLRSISSSLVLASWFKHKLRSAFLTKAYADQNKIRGVASTDSRTPQRLWEQYMEAFRQGAYSFIKEDQDPLTGDMIVRKYTSGGLQLQMPDPILIDLAEVPERKYRRAAVILEPVKDASQPPATRKNTNGSRTKPVAPNTFNTLLSAIRNNMTPWLKKSPDISVFLLQINNHIAALRDLLNDAPLESDGSISAYDAIRTEIDSVPIVLSKKQAGTFTKSLEQTAGITKFPAEIPLYVLRDIYLRSLLPIINADGPETALPMFAGQLTLDKEDLALLRAYWRLDDKAYPKSSQRLFRELKEETDPDLKAALAAGGMHQYSVDERFKRITSILRPLLAQHPNPQENLTPENRAKLFLEIRDEHVIRKEEEGDFSNAFSEESLLKKIQNGLWNDFDSMSAELSDNLIIPLPRILEVLRNIHISPSSFRAKQKTQTQIVAADLPVFLIKRKTWVSVQPNMLENIIKTLIKFYNDPENNLHEGFYHLTLANNYAFYARLIPEQGWYIVVCWPKGQTKLTDGVATIDNNLRDYLRELDGKDATAFQEESIPLMIDRSQAPQTPGGIDLDPSSLDISIETNQDTQNSPLSKSMQTILEKGLTPLIRAISPAEISVASFFK